MISIVIPTHNREENINLNLMNLTQQTFKDFEVVVVDDGSTDDTADIVLSYTHSLKKLKYVYLYKKIDWNASRPRNYGAKLAEQDTHAYLFLDSDVLLNEKALEHYVEGYTKNPNRIIIGQYDWLPPQEILEDDVVFKFNEIVKGEMPRKTVKGRLGHIGEDVRKPSFEKGTPDDTFNEIYDGLACFGGNLLVPRKMFWKMGGFDEDTHCGLEDGEFGIRAWKHGFDFSYDQRCVGYHVWHETPASRFPPNLREQINALNRKHFGEDNPDLGIINATKETFKRWGIDWQVPPEWEANEG